MHVTYSLGEKSQIEASASFTDKETESPRKEASGRGRSARWGLAHTSVLPSGPLGRASPGQPCSLTGWTVANGFLHVLHPDPNLAQMALVTVSNRFLISKSCPAIPPNSRVGARYPLPGLPPFEVSDIWFQLRFNRHLPRSAQYKHCGHRGRCCFLAVSHTPCPLWPRRPAVPLHLASSPPIR